MFSIIKNMIRAFCWGCVGFLLGDYYACGRWKCDIARADREMLRYKNYYEIMSTWMDLKQRRVSLNRYFIERNIKTIAIYGMQEIGNYLYQELTDLGLDVRYAIDQNAGRVYSELDVYCLEDELPKVDLIIVTPVHIAGDIICDIRKHSDIMAVSLRDVLLDI